MTFHLCGGRAGHATTSSFTNLKYDICVKNLKTHSTFDTLKKTILTITPNNLESIRIPFRSPAYDLQINMYATQNVKI